MRIPISAGTHLCLLFRNFARSNNQLNSRLNGRVIAKLALQWQKLRERRRLAQFALCK